MKLLRYRTGIVIDYNLGNRNQTNTCPTTDNTTDNNTTFYTENTSNVYGQKKERLLCLASNLMVLYINRNDTDIQIPKR